MNYVCWKHKNNAVRVCFRVSLNMDHQYSQYNNTYNEDMSDMMFEEHVSDTDTGNTVNNTSVLEKEGDDYLIQLYRERRFLYDKSHRDFRDNELKNNAWKEISSIMRNKNMGNFYTAEYCKRRMTSLREKYAKLKKEQDLKSGSAACTTRKSALLSELSFLDVYIQRRRTLTNMKENNGRMPASSSNKNAVECPETNVAESTNLNNRNYKERSLSPDNIEDDLIGNLCDQTPSKKFKKSAVSKKNNENDDTFRDLTNAAINIVKQLQTDSKSTEDVGSTSAEQAFAQFIVLSLQRMQNPERNIRQNKIFHVLTAPLEQLIHHCCKNYWNYCIRD